MEKYEWWVEIEFILKIKCPLKFVVTTKNSKIVYTILSLLKVNENFSICKTSLYFNLIRH